jgi:formate dehydrogenase major subunit
MGSNMAECHPVGFQWVIEAKLRGARVIHVDPRFTRTSALADTYVALRAGSDIAFLGGLVHHILENELDFREYVVAYTNAATIVSEDFVDTEELDGLFSGYDPATQTYDPASWMYAGMSASPAATERGQKPSDPDTAGAHGVLVGGLPPERDETLQHPRCVFQILRRHFARYTPEVVEEICGVPQAEFLAVADALCAASGRERTAAFCYAVGWTQHTVGVQYIRTAAIVQLLLGNMGRPGGGIMALRGHASIQGSTDIPTLYNLLPGYIPMPHAHEHRSLADLTEVGDPRTGAWGAMDGYVVSLLKAWWGEHATAANDFCFDHLPRIDGDHSAYKTILDMADGKLEGYFLMGENPAVGSANGGLHRRALANLDWLVVRDLVEIESATFWRDGPEIASGELRTQDIRTEVFLMPAAAHTEKDGTFTNTQRLLQWHHKAVEPPGDCRSELWFTFHLGRLIRERLAASTDRRDLPATQLTWDYPTHGPTAEPDAEAILAEISGRRHDGSPVDGYHELAADGSTSCGCWIYSGVMAGGVNQSARRRPGREQSWVAPDWGWAWPANRRMLYNRASADPEGRPWSEAKAYVWWDEEAGRWTGHDTPDFVVDRPPGYEPPKDAVGLAALSGRSPFIMQADGVGWLYAPSGLLDGPLPAHYEPQESPFENTLYGQRANPVRIVRPRRHDRLHPAGGAAGSDVYPYVMTTYRLTEHHTAGGMSRTVSHLSELQPEMFCEVSPALAAQRGLENAGWATIVTARAAIEARVLVTDRMKPLVVQGRELHQVGLPYHWGANGLVTGDSANDLFHLALDPNVQIEEVKAATCDVIAGRRPRGPALLELLEAHRLRAGLPADAPGAETLP